MLAFSDVGEAQRVLREEFRDLRLGRWLSYNALATKYGLEELPFGYLLNDDGRYNSILEQNAS